MTDTGWRPIEPPYTASDCWHMIRQILAGYCFQMAMFLHYNPSPALVAAWYATAIAMRDEISPPTGDE